MKTLSRIAATSCVVGCAFPLGCDLLEPDRNLNAYECRSAESSTAMGRVRVAGTDEPAVGVWVSIRERDGYAYGPALKAVQADSRGRFSLNFQYECSHSYYATAGTSPQFNAVKRLNRRENNGIVLTVPSSELEQET
jgi:hypothetical protein